MNDHRGALEAVDRILNRGGEADDVLRAIVELLHDRFDRYSGVGIYLVEDGELVLGPSAGSEAAESVRVPISFDGRVVGELAIDSDDPASLGDADRELLERVALLVSPHCLVAWDTSGEPWAR